MCRINQKIDRAYKKLFGNEQNKDLLISLINSIIRKKDQVADLTLTNPYNLPNYLNGKLPILDIKAVNETGKHFNIEMQALGHKDFDLSSLYYLAKTFNSQITSNKKFKSLNKTIIINITDFDFFNDKNKKNKKGIEEDIEKVAKTINY